MQKLAANRDATGDDATTGTTDLARPGQPPDGQAGPAPASSCDVSRMPQDYQTSNIGLIMDERMQSLLATVEQKMATLEQRLTIQAESQEQRAATLEQRLATLEQHVATQEQQRAATLEQRLVTLEQQVATQEQRLKVLPCLVRHYASDLSASVISRVVSGD
jgi:uncharacterized coiled-coil protein SlyX